MMLTCLFHLGEHERSLCCSSGSDTLPPGSAGTKKKSSGNNKAIQSDEGAGIYFSIVVSPVDCERLQSLVGHVTRDKP